MKATLLIQTPKGFYAEEEFTATTVKGALDKVLPKLDKLPDEIDGARALDWSTITLTIQRQA